MRTRSSFTRPLIAAIAIAGALDLAANILAAKVMIPLPLGLLAPGGTALFSLAFVTYDYVRRQGGVAPTVAAITLGFGLSMAYTVAFGGGVGRIAVAGLIALAASSTADLVTQTFTLKLPIPHYVFISNAVSLALDTVIFASIAFAALPPAVRVQIMEGQYLMKITMTLVAIPLVVLARHYTQPRTAPLVTYSRRRMA